MNRMQGFHGFVLNDDETIYKSVNTIASINFLVFLNNWKLYLGFCIPTSLTKFISMAVLVSGFQQTRPQYFVYLNCTVYNICSNRLNVYHLFFPSLKRIVRDLRSFAVKRSYAVLKPLFLLPSLKTKPSRPSPLRGEKVLCRSVITNIY